MQKQDKTLQPERLKELDVFRALAIIPIMLCHYPGHFLTQETGWDPDMLPIPFPYGAYGVQFFFLISGFTIFFSLRKDQRPLNFIIARFSRLYPAYWCALLLSVFAVRVIGLANWEISNTQILFNFTMFQRFFLVPSIEPPHWYLTFELMFYGIMLSLFVLRLTGKMDIVCGLWLGLQLATWVAQEYFGAILSEREKGLLLIEFANLFIAGIIFYKIKFEKASLYRWSVISCCLLAQWLLHGKISGLIVSSFFLMFILFIRGHLTWIICRPLVYLGSISYSIFLIHHNLGLAIMQNFYHAGLDLTLSITIGVLIIISLADLITRYIEKPAIAGIRKVYFGLLSKIG